MLKRVSGLVYLALLSILISFDGGGVAMDGDFLSVCFGWHDACSS